MPTPIPPQLGKVVTFRSFSWLEMVERAWSGEYRRPDHNVYRFSDGRGFDSTDQYATGIYRKGISQTWTADDALTRASSTARVDSMSQPETW